MATYTNPIDLERDKALEQLGLPPIAYVCNKDRIYHASAPVIAIKRGEAGFHPIQTRLQADEHNKMEGVTPAQREAMLMGSMFGWHSPGADPEFHVKLQALDDAKKGGAE